MTALDEIQKKEMENFTLFLIISGCIIMGLFVMIMVAIFSTIPH